MGKTYHPEHFACVRCNINLASENFYERDGQAYCERDFHEVYAPQCAHCHGPILGVRNFKQMNANTLNELTKNKHNWKTGSHFLWLPGFCNSLLGNKTWPVSVMIYACMYGQQGPGTKSWLCMPNLQDRLAVVSEAIFKHRHALSHPLHLYVASVTCLLLHRVLILHSVVLCERQSLQW